MRMARMAQVGGVSGAAGERFFNREWSWLRFNERVLEEAEDQSNPLLERLKFAAIFATNLDEFFMIRVAGLYRQLDAGIQLSGADRRSPTAQLDGIAELMLHLASRHERVVGELIRDLAERGIRIAGLEQLDTAERLYAHRYYHDVMYPVLTPTIVGPKHPFPTLPGCTLCLAVRLEGGPEFMVRARRTVGRKRRTSLGLISLPRVLPRFLRVGEANAPVLVPIESILVHHLPELYAGYRVVSVDALRLNRDADIALDEEAAEDLRRAMAKKLLRRRHGAVVRLEHGRRMQGKVKRLLQRELDLQEAQLYPCGGLMQAGDLMQVYASVDGAGLKYPPMQALPLVASRPRSMFALLQRGPRLVHHPFHAFDPVAELVAEAADDPDVLAIKQTLYRTSGDSPVVKALTRAAERGKQVTVVVELRARFDEERNIEWASRLEQAGAHVVYGLVGFKTHCKALLVIRRQEEGIRRYVHLGTGNYNDATARLYTDMGLFTADDAYGEDVSALFNVITGAAEPPAWNKLEMAPTGMRRRLLNAIEREIDTSAPRARGRIIAKMNALVDEDVIEALYAASRAGVRVDLIVRGICCLRPGVKGLSENIRVRSIVARFLEHSRVMWLRNGGQEEVYLSSADWMPRNLDHRIEVMFPIEDASHREYIKGLLDLQLRDNVRARELGPDGRYRRVSQAGPRLDSQLASYAYTRALLRTSAPPRHRLLAGTGGTRA